MFDDLVTYFYDTIVVSFEEYLGVASTSLAGRHRDTRAAIIAATSLYHFREHFPSGSRPSYTSVSTQCPDYALVRDIVNASKHHSLTKGTPLIRDAAQIVEQVIVTQYEDTEGVYTCVDKVVSVKLTNGSERDVLEVTTNVMNFWQDYLHSISVIKKRPNYSIPQKTDPRSRAECGAGQLDLEMVRGLRFRQAFKFQRYDPVRSKIVPLDLTGSEVSLRIFPRQRMDVEVAVKNEKTGTEARRTVTLNEEESETLLKQNTDRDKDLYLQTLPIIKETLQELAAETKQC